MAFPQAGRALIAIVLIVAQLLWPMPVLAQSGGLPGMGDTGNMTASAERELGDRVIRSLYRDSDYIDDPVVGEYVDGIWQRLLAGARKRGELTADVDERFAWTILMGRDASVNAFALPGGYLGLHMGLIAVTGTADELAMVLAHELTHITQRHIARNLSKEKNQAPLMLAALLLSALAASRSVDAGQAIMMGSQAALVRNQLGFSRDMEREADRIGFGVLTEAGFAPRGAADMFARLEFANRLSDNGSYPYLRTHPLSSERVADMQQRIALAPQAPAAATLLHTMIAARATVLTRPGSDRLRQTVSAAQGGVFDAANARTQAGLLYGAAFAASELRDFGAARQLAARLESRTAGRADAARLARLLAAEIEATAGAPARARALLPANPTQRPEMLLAAPAAIALAARAPSKDARDALLAPLAEPLRDWTASHPNDATAWRALSGVQAARNQTLASIRSEAEAAAAELDFIAAHDRLRAAQDLVRQRGATPGAPPVDHFEASIVDARARQIEDRVRAQREEKPL